MSLCPFHKKPLRILSIALITHLGYWRAIRWYMGIAVRTALIRVTLPAGRIRAAFQPWRRSATLSIRERNSLLGSFCGESGSPKYLQGNSTTWQGRASCIAATSCTSHWIIGKLIFYAQNFVMRYSMLRSHTKVCFMVERNFIVYYIFQLKRISCFLQWG